MKGMALTVEIKPVGLDDPTRYDIYVPGVNGAFCAYCFSKEQAESWAEGIQTALNESFKRGKQSGFNEHKTLNN